VSSAKLLMLSYGRVPPNISMKMHPIAQRSTFSVIFVLQSKSSGAMYLGDPPLFFFEMCVRSMDSVSPKSHNFTFKFRSRTTFCVFRSLWTTTGFCECRYLTPSANCMHMLMA